jgi:hypothetical protein
MHGALAHEARRSSPVRYTQCVYVRTMENKADVNLAHDQGRRLSRSSHHRQSSFISFQASSRLVHVVLFLRNTWNICSENCVL